MNINTPDFSREEDGDTKHRGSQQAGFSKKEEAAMCESEEETSDCESVEEGIFPLDCEGLDLEQIENNWDRCPPKEGIFILPAEMLADNIAVSVSFCLYMLPTCRKCFKWG